LNRSHADFVSLCSTTLSNLIMNIAAILGQAYSNDNASPMQSATLGRTRGYQEIVGKRSSFSFDVVNTALVRVFAVIDPVSEQAQKWSSLLQVRFSPARLQLAANLASNDLTDGLRDRSRFAHGST
jgi:UDP-glucose:glycoprotein glucosyltransferase